VVGVRGELGLRLCASYHALSGQFGLISWKGMIVLQVFCGLGEELLGEVKSKYYVVVGVLR
jgi:hypothetical protein